MLKKMAALRAAKERKRLANDPPDEPQGMRVVRHPFLSWAMRDDLSGEVVWMEFKSVRDMTLRAGMVARHYQPSRLR